MTLRGLARAACAGLALGSIVMTGWTAAEFARHPVVSVYIDASASEIAARLEAEMARFATPERLATRVESRLAEQPRNWVALDALADVAAERGPLPAALSARLEAVRAADHGVLAQTEACLACAWDTTVCNPANLVMCKIPDLLTPLGDVAGLTRGAQAYLTGGEVDALEVGLSAIGLSATALVLASGGSSLSVKAGAGVMRLALKSGQMSPRLVAAATDAARTGLRWDALPALRSRDDLARLVRSERLAPMVAIAGDLGRIRAATGTAEAIHLLRLVDDAGDARRLARTAEAVGPKVVGRAEVLGKARLMRATRVISPMAKLAAALFALIAALMGLLLSTAQIAARLGLRRLAFGRTGG